MKKMTIKVAREQMFKKGHVITHKINGWIFDLESPIYKKLHKLQAV